MSPRGLWTESPCLVRHCCCLIRLSEKWSQISVVKNFPPAICWFNASAFAAFVLIWKNKYDDSWNIDLKRWTKLIYEIQLNVSFFTKKINKCFFLVSLLGFYFWGSWIWFGHERLELMHYGAIIVLVNNDFCTKSQLILTPLNKYKEENIQRICHVMSCHVFHSDLGRKLSVVSVYFF